MTVPFLGLVLAFLLFPTASAEDPDSAFVTVLRPGDNLVGWVAKAEPVESLFEAVPQIQNVWTWDAAGDRWRFAAPSAPSRMWSLRTLTPGMGLRVWLGGQQPVDWTRGRIPARGAVALEPGFNLVAWMGDDGVPLDRVVMGIGRSLLQALVWSPIDGGLIRRERHSLSRADAHPAVRFGDAIWVEVERSVNWLQPTGVMPELISEGVSTRPSSRLHTSLQVVLDFYADHFGMQADPFQLSIRIDQGMYTVYDPRLNQIVLAARLARPETRCGLIGPLVHEYAHALQDQHSNDNYWLPPQWLIEGTAEWAVREWLSHPGNSCGTGGDRSLRTPIGSELARLPHLEAIRVAPDIHFTPDAYRLGEIASTRLAERPGGATPFEFYRMIRGQTEPSDAQLPLPSYERSFVDAFGISLMDWYAEFAAWRSDLNGHPSNHRQSSEQAIRGQVVLENGTPV